MISRFTLATTTVLLFNLAMNLGCVSIHTKRGEERMPANMEDTPDNLLWLEEIEGKSSLDWVRSHNEKALSHFNANPLFTEIQKDLRATLLAKDRIAFPSFIGFTNEKGSQVTNFWQDDKNIRGRWRQTSLRSYLSKTPSWETLLDIDDLGKKEKESWVFKGASCLPSQPDLCLISLSRGGKDAVTVREFKRSTRSFIPETAGGFVVPEAKSDVAWRDEKSLFIATDFGPNSLTDSGYPRIVKLWNRGTPLTKAATLFEGTSSDMSVSALTLFSPEGSHSFLTRQIDFFTSELYYVQPNLKITLLPIPKDAILQGIFENLLLIRLRTAWQSYPSGSVLSIPIASLVAQDNQWISAIEPVFTPTARTFLSDLNRSKNTVYLSVLDNVQGKLWAMRRQNGKWIKIDLTIPAMGSVSIASSSAYHNDVFYEFESFLTPTTLYFLRPKSATEFVITTAKSLPHRFNSTSFVVEQFETASADGEKIPYFLIRNKSLPYNGANPTLLYGYGGFEVSETPFYLANWGKPWLERGGTFVLANIRGGGEFGPRWHQAALLKNRQLAFNDFIAIQEDLIRRSITSPRHLGIMGGSNGGLLVGASLTQRPDLINAVVCQVPLLDMLRYHKLLAGASWMAEYGNPDDPAMRPIIRAYSPYQNLKSGTTYPKTFFTTSTKDDRVHPGHARKMVAALEALGQEVIYFENMEGGHSAAADPEQSVRRKAMEFTYLWEQLR